MSSSEILRSPTSGAPTDPEVAERTVAVELTALTKTYGDTNAVSGINLRAHQGELIAVLGASGSGKTTLLRLIAGFEAVSQGTVSLFGHDVSRLSPADREIGMVFQNYALMPHLTVRKNVEYGLKMRGWQRSKRHERVTEMLERMRLESFGDRLPRQLSGGQQQRVAIARALAYSPKLLLMDEPMGALDKALKQELLAEIRRVHREFSTTIFYVTHDREEALMLADRVALMADGELIDCSPVHDMYMRPETRLAAEFFSGANLLPVEVVSADDNEATVRFGQNQHTISGKANGASALLAFRPRDTVWGDLANGWTIDAVVEDSVFIGDDLRITVTARGLEESTHRLTLLLPAVAANELNVGDRVRVGVDPATCHLIDEEAAK